jgi:TolB-like protein
MGNQFKEKIINSDLSNFGVFKVIDRNALTTCYSPQSDK